MLPYFSRFHKYIASFEMVYAKIWNTSPIGPHNGWGADKLYFGGMYCCLICVLDCFVSIED